MGKPFYATVEQLQAAADYKSTAYEAERLRRILDGASRDIELSFHRHYYPLTEAVTFTDPPTSTPRRVQSAGFDLDRDLLALTAATEDGTSATLANVELHPGQYGPPYWWIGLTGSTIVVTGRWGYSEDTAPAGALEAAISDTTGTSVDVTNSALIGVGDLILVDSEQMIVTAKLQLDSGQNLSNNPTASVSDVTIGLTDGTKFAVGEIILIDAEDMLIVAISGNNGTVKRAYNGSVLAAHSATADIYAPRTLTVERGAVGTTAATHLDAATITKNVPPGPIVDFCIAEALSRYENESAGYLRQVGTGESAREARGAGLAVAHRQASPLRRVRLAAV